jgi:phage terminase large subunit-like protein
MAKPEKISCDIIKFIETLICPSGYGAGKPFKLLPFQKKFIRDVYDPVDESGKRIVRRAILSMARKNGKTMMVAALALAHLLIDKLAIKNGECYSAACEREQAGIIFRYATQIVRADSELMSMIKIVDSTKTMINSHNGSISRALSAEAGTKYGLNPSFLVYDELAQAKNRDLLDALDTSMAAREEPLLIIISTQSNDPQHVLSQLIDDGLSGRDPTTVCHLHAIPDDADDEAIFTDRKLWRLANPALSKFRSLSEMKTAAGRAKRMPSFEASYKNLYCNQRIDSQNPLISGQDWKACAKNYRIDDGERVYLGLDLASTTDLCALVLVSAENGDRVKAWAWKPGDTLRDHETRDRAPYTVWKKQGWIDAPAGRALDYGIVAKKVAEINVKYRILGLAYDRWRINNFLQELNRIGVESLVEGQDYKVGDPIPEEAVRLVPWGQGYASMGPAVDAVENSVIGGTLAHDGNPVLTWCVSNAIATTGPSGDRKLDKAKSRFRIDLAQAMFMAIGLKKRDQEVKEAKPSRYETEGEKVIVY